jgi:hypothetical protein
MDYEGVTVRYPNLKFDIVDPSLWTLAKMSDQSLKVPAPSQRASCARFSLPASSLNCCHWRPIRMDGSRSPILASQPTQVDTCP